MRTFLHSQVWDFAMAKKGVDAMVAFTKRKLIDRILSKGLDSPELRHTTKRAATHTHTHLHACNGFDQ